MDFVLFQTVRLKNAFRLLCFFCVSLASAYAAAPAADGLPGLFDKGRESYLIKDFGEAKTYFERCVSLEPENAEYKCWLAQTIAFQLGERVMKGSSKLSLLPDGRILWDLYEKAFALDPRSERARIGFAVLLRDLPGIMGGNVDKAETLLSSVLEDNPENLFALHHMGTLHTKKKKQYDTGVHFLQKAIDLSNARQLSPEESMRISNTYNALGQVYLKDLHQPEAALEYLRDAVNLDPENVGNLLNLVDAYQLLDRKDEAKDALRQAATVIQSKHYKVFLKEARAFAKKLKMTKELNL